MSDKEKLTELKEAVVLYFKAKDYYHEVIRSSRWLSYMVHTLPYKKADEKLRQLAELVRKNPE